MRNLGGAVPETLPLGFRAQQRASIDQTYIKVAARLQDKWCLPCRLPDLLQRNILPDIDSPAMAILRSSHKPNNTKA
jgi:hypothetical protein